MIGTPLLCRLWKEYEYANMRSCTDYNVRMGRQRQIRDQAGRQRATQQIRSTRSVEAGTR